MATLSLSIVAPDRTVFDGPVNSLLAPGVDGYFGVMAGHVPLIASLKPGILEYVGTTGERHNVYVGGGFIETNGARATVLADEAQLATDIDIAKTEQAIEEARRSLRGEETTMSPEDATLELERAMQRMKAARLGR